MSYPTISEYIESIRYAEDNFATLTNLRSVLDNDGNPVMSSGNFAVVFKMKDIESGKLFALKCFTRYQEGRDQAYRQIADYLADVDVPWLLPVKYLEDELFVDTAQSVETEFPVLLMDWAEGTPLDVFIDNCRSSVNLQTLSYRFALMATWLLRQPFAHGDLKPDNILVNPTTFQPVLVDYDGMFVPAMNGQKARELGSPDYRHPRRTIDDFNEHIDDFALTVMQLLIDAGHAAGKKSIHYHVADLTLHDRDFADIANSGTMRTYFSYFDNAVLVKTYIHFLQTLQSESMTIPDSVISNWESIIPDNERLWFDHNVKYTENWVKLISAPETIEIYVIKDGCNEINDNAFSGCSGLTSVTIGNSVTKIGSSAFYGCSGLTSITIPDSVTSIGERAFDGCSGLTSVTFGNSVTEIGREAFEDCGGLTSLSIPDSVTEIGGSAFSGCSGLTSVTIGNSVTKIGDYAFYSCSGLTSIVIPDSVTEIGGCAFDGCSGLTSITIPDSVTKIGDLAFGNTAWFDNQPFGLIYAGMVAYKYKGQMLPGSHIEIKDGTTLISSWCFADCSGLTSVTIPDSVTEIGDRAFGGCSGLTSIVIPDSVTEISWGAFYGCSGLVSIVIPDSVTKISWEAFYGCSGLTKVEISDLAAWCKIKFGGSDANPLRCARHLYLNGSEIKDLVIPDSVTKIGERAFYGCSGLTSVTIGNSVTKIGWEAFRGCSGLTSLSIPDSVTEIGGSAFSGCSGLTSIVIPDSVTEIGDHAFDECSGLTSIVIPDSVTKIGDVAFRGCSGLRTITVAQGNTKYDSRNDCNTIIETASNTLIVGCKNTIIPDSVTEIGDWAFGGCSGLTSIVIPDSVTKIGVCAFDGCSGLVSIVIPDSVTSIGDYAFDDCSGLRTITVAQGNTKYDSRNDCNTIIETASNTLIVGCKNTIIPDSVTEIGEGAFGGCSGLTSIVIPDSVTKIGVCAFDGCSGLVSIVIPDSVTSIGDYAFDDCSGLTSIIIPRGSLDRFREMRPYELRFILIEQ